MASKSISNSYRYSFFRANTYIMSSKLTKVIANFETSLATKLANGAVAGALTSIVDKNGVNLPTGKYCMIIDRGTGDEEHLVFDLSGTAMTNIFSISRQGVQTAG